MRDNTKNLYDKARGNKQQDWANVGEYKYKIKEENGKVRLSSSVK